jgi:hypothetical protein
MVCSDAVHRGAPAVLRRAARRVELLGALMPPHKRPAPSALLLLLLSHHPSVHLATTPSPSLAFALQLSLSHITRLASASTSVVSHRTLASARSPWQTIRSVRLRAAPVSLQAPQARSGLFLSACDSTQVPSLARLVLAS